jgi:hypothetical protein
MFSVLLFSFLFFGVTAKAYRWCKVIFIGDFKSGKSELIRAYFREPFYRGHDRTTDLFAREIVFNYNGENINLIIWDAVEEEEAHNVVNAFFCSSDIAFIVVDMYKLVESNFCINEIRNRIDRWADKLKQNASGCKVILVGTKIDEISGIDLERAKQSLVFAANTMNNDFQDTQVIFVSAKCDRENAGLQINLSIVRAMTVLEYITWIRTTKTLECILKR